MKETEVEQTKLNDYTTLLSRGQNLIYRSIYSIFLISVRDKAMIHE